MSKKIIITSVVTVFLLLMGSCQSNSVRRTAADEEIDLSGRWNDTDAKLVAEKMVESAISKPWLDEFTGTNDRRPVIVIGWIRNKTSEHIPVESFSNKIEGELINSGKIDFVAGSAEREEVRSEKNDQQGNASEETAKALAQEVGADFMLTGDITSIEDTLDNRKVVFYSISMELIDIETNRKVWKEIKEIKKDITKSKSKF